MFDTENTDNAASDNDSGFPGLPEAIDNDDAGTDNAAPAAPSSPPARDDDRGGKYQPPVDLSALPDDIRGPIEARISHLTKIMGKNDRKHARELQEWRELAAEQSRRLEELSQGFTTIAAQTEERSFAEMESRLASEMNAAYEAGNVQAYNEAHRKLIDLKVEKAVAERERKAEPKKEEKKPQTPMRQPQNNMNDEDQAVVDAWQDERDESGRMLRPWAYNRGTPEEPDEDYLRAVAETHAVLMNPRFRNSTMEEKMAEVDRRMGVTRPAGRQPVMGGNLTRGAKPSKLTLNEAQRKIAVKMKLGGPKAKSDADHIEAYRKQLEQMKGGR